MIHLDLILNRRLSNSSWFNYWFTDDSMLHSDSFTNSESTIYFRTENLQFTIFDFYTFYINLDSFSNRGLLNFQMVTHHLIHHDSFPFGDSTIHFKQATHVIHLSNSWFCHLSLSLFTNIDSVIHLGWMLYSDRFSSNKLTLEQQTDSFTTGRACDSSCFLFLLFKRRAVMILYDSFPNGDSMIHFDSLACGESINF